MDGPKLSPVMREIAPKAEQVFRDQYVLEFLGGKEYEHENSMKKALIDQMKRFVLELGKDFLFMEEEYRLQVGNSDYRSCTLDRITTKNNNTMKLQKLLTLIAALMCIFFLNANDAIAQNTIDVNGKGPGNFLTKEAL